MLTAIQFFLIRLAATDIQKTRSSKTTFSISSCPLPQQIVESTASITSLIQHHYPDSIMTDYTTVQTTTDIPPVKGWAKYLEESDLLDPTTLADKTFGTDYIYLAHETKEELLDKIYAEGLKTPSRLMQDSDVTDETRQQHNRRTQTKGELTSDVNHLHFRPVWPGPGSTKIEPNSIILAAHPNSVNAFNEHIRDETKGTESQWKSTSINILDLATRHRTKSAGTFINRRGRPQQNPTTDYQRAQTCYLPYRQESVADVDWIKPTFFVDPSMVSEAVKRQAKQW